MLRPKIFFLLFTIVGLASAAVGQEQGKGYVLRTLTHNGKAVAQPGDIHDLKVGEHGTWLQTPTANVNLRGDEIIPLDRAFTPARAYIWLLEHPPSRIRSRHYEALERFKLCQSLIKRYPRNELHEPLMALSCDYYFSYERATTMGKTDWEATLRILDAYLRTYPSGSNAGRLHFKRFELTHDLYEYEGSTQLILTQIELYQGYLVANQDSDVIDDVRLKLARLYRLAYECFPKDNVKEKKWVLSKATKLYRELLQSRDLETRQRARIALYNIREGRRTYAGVNDW